MITLIFFNDLFFAYPFLITGIIGMTLFGISFGLSWNFDGLILPRLFPKNRLRTIFFLYTENDSIYFIESKEMMSTFASGFDVNINKCPQCKKCWIQMPSEPSKFDIDGYKGPKTIAKGYLFARLHKSTVPKPIIHKCPLCFLGKRKKDLEKYYFEDKSPYS